jgi:hypothetical protein
LLRVLFVRLGGMPADAKPGSAHLSTKVAEIDGDGTQRPG